MLAKAFKRLNFYAPARMMFARDVTAVDDVKEATILTDDKSSFGDEEFMGWVNEGKSEKKIAHRTEKRNAFYKLGFNKNHIPCQGNYEKTRKTRLL